MSNSCGSQMADTTKGKLKRLNKDYNLSPQSKAISTTYGHERYTQYIHPQLSGEL